MRVHDLSPAPGATKKPKRVGRGIGGKGGKTAGRGTKGQHARNTVRPRLRGWPDAAQAARPEAEGLQQPVPRRVLGRQPATRSATLGESTVDRSRCSSQRGVVRKGAFVKILARGEINCQASTSTPTPSRRPPRRRSPPPVVRSRSIPLPFKRGGQGRPAAGARATSSPTGDALSA